MEGYKNEDMVERLVKLAENNTKKRKEIKGNLEVSIKILEEQADREIENCEKIILECTEKILTRNNLNKS